jgi:D-alanyl-D-alanine carboxypeptidase
VVTDQWTWSGAAGKDAVGTPLLPNTSMAVASITKTFIAAEVLLLAKARKVDLDKPLSAYVKHKLTANEATVRQHLSMTSGVPDFRPDDYTRLDKAIAAAPAKHWTAEQALTYDTAQPGQPGSPYNYSNPSSCGAAFDGYIPCRAIASLTAANAGLAADAPTIARWGYQLYGDRVVPAELVRQMTAGDGQYGLGTMRYSQQFGLGDAFGHGGNDPGYSSLMVAIPGHKDAGRIAEELVTAIQPLLGH